MIIFVVYWDLNYIDISFMTCYYAIEQAYSYLIDITSGHIIQHRTSGSSGYSCYLAPLLAANDIVLYILLMVLIAYALLVKYKHH